MNRTFNAFAVLLALLVATSWAVNWDDRSTSREPVFTAPIRHFPRHKPGRGIQAEP